MKGGQVDGINCKNEDIIAYSPLSGHWFTLFDGSDVELEDNPNNVSTARSESAEVLTINREPKEK